MRTLLCCALLMMAGCAMAQEKQCRENSDNVYTDGPCEMYHSCTWSGRKYRAVGRCWKVLVTAPEKKNGPFNRKVVPLCDDRTKLPRSCQKEFDQLDEGENVERCLSRRIQDHHSAFVKMKCGEGIHDGCSWYGDEEKQFVDEMILADRTMAAKECSPPSQP